MIVETQSVIDRFGAYLEKGKRFNDFEKGKKRVARRRRKKDEGEWKVLPMLKPSEDEDPKFRSPSPSAIEFNEVDESVSEDELSIVESVKHDRIDR